MTSLPKAVAGAVLGVCVAANVALADQAQDLAPTGRLRAAINFGNPVLAGRGKTGVLVAFVAAALCGGAVTLINFFVGAGAQL